MPVVKLDDMRHGMVILVPLRRLNGATQVLLPPGSSSAIAFEHEGAHGAASASRKAVQAAAEVAAQALAVPGAAKPRATAAEYCKIRGVEVTLTVAFWPAAAVLARHAVEAGLQWLASSKQYATPRQHLCEAVERYANMAFAPARLEAAPVTGDAGADKYALREARRGAVGPRATIKSVDASTLALVDREAARSRSAAALHDLRSRLTAAAAAERGRADGHRL